MTEQRTRRCNLCNRHLPVDQFRKRTSTKTKYDRKRIGQPYGWCRSCQRKRDLARRSTIDGFLDNVFSNVRSRSNKAGIEFDLTKEHLREMYATQEGRCAVTAIPMTAVIGHGVIYTNISVDRIEAGGPYTKNNTRLVCHIVNIMRNAMNDDELRYWTKKIAKGLGRPP